MIGYIITAVLVAGSLAWLFLDPPAPPPPAVDFWPLTIGLVCAGLCSLGGVGLWSWTTLRAIRMKGKGGPCAG